MTDVARMIIWGNHSATHILDFEHATIGGKPAAQVLGDPRWLEETFVGAVQNRGTEAIKDPRRFVGGFGCERGDRRMLF